MSKYLSFIIIPTLNGYSVKIPWLHDDRTAAELSTVISYSPYNYGILEGTLFVGPNNPSYNSTYIINIDENMLIDCGYYRMTPRINNTNIGSVSANATIFLAVLTSFDNISILAYAASNRYNEFITFTDGDINISPGYFVFNNTGTGDYTIRTFGNIAGTSSVDINSRNAANLLISKNIIEPTDPYTPGGTTTEQSETAGGTGDFDNTSTPIDFPALPNLSATYTVFQKLYSPTLTELENLASYMWSSSLFDLDTFKKLFANPMDCILGLSIVPVPLNKGSATEVKVGNLGTGINMQPIMQQFVEIDCGSINVNEYWGAYLDYDPYTKAEIYLPYIGTHALAIDDIMNKTIQVKYHVEIISGSCCAYIKCGDSVLYTFVGQCSCTLPVTSSDWNNIISGALSIGASIGSLVALGGATAPMTVGTVAQTATNSLKPNIEKSGSLSGTGGLMGIQTPYLILTRPKQALPANQNSYIGYPSFLTAKLSDLSGYTEVEKIHLENIQCTHDELLEIELLLREGVII